MPQTSYDTINSLTEISFIAGTEYILTFDVYDINMSPLVFQDRLAHGLYHHMDNQNTQF